MANIICGITSKQGSVAKGTLQTSVVEAVANTTNIEEGNETRLKALDIVEATASKPSRKAETIFDLSKEMLQKILEDVRIEHILAHPLGSLMPPHPLLHTSHQLRSEYLQVQRLAIRKLGRPVRLEFYGYPTGPRFVADSGEPGYIQEAYADEPVPWLRTLKRGIELKEVLFFMSEPVEGEWSGHITVKLDGKFHAPSG